EGASAAPAPALASTAAPVALEPPAWTQAAGRTPGYADWEETPPPPSPARGRARGTTATAPGGVAWERVSTRASWAVAGLVAWMMAAGFAIIGYINEMTLIDALDTG